MKNERYRGLLRRMVYELFGVGGGEEDIPTPAAAAARRAEGAAEGDTALSKTAQITEDPSAATLPMQRGCAVTID